MQYRLSIASFKLKASHMHSISVEILFTYPRALSKKFPEIDRLKQTRQLASGRSPECSDCLLRSMEQY